MIYSNTLMATRDISNTRGARYIPHVGLGPINDILGRRSTRGSIGISGVNPQRITADEINSGRIYARDFYSAPANFESGNSTIPSITFLNASSRTGLYTNADHAIVIAYDGAGIATFGPGGLIVGDLFGPSGTIDFHGANLINVGSVSSKAGSYELVGDPVNSADDTPIEIMRVPVIVPVGATSITLELTVRILYVSRNSADGSVSGSMSFNARANRGLAAPNVTERYNTVTYSSAALATTNVTIGINGDDVVIYGIGPTVIPMSWQVVVKVTAIAK